MNDNRIKGFCPMGCGETLFVTADGHITCSWPDCKAPGAADEILSDPETDHIVVFGEQGWTVRHPLRERLNDDLLNCDIHGDLAKYDGPPVTPGCYRARWIPFGIGTWRFELIKAAS